MSNEQVAPETKGVTVKLLEDIGVAVLVILIAGILASRGLGALGVDALSSWPAATRAGLALMLFFTASAHFTRMREDLVRMTPPWVPRLRALVSCTGVCEVLGAIGILIPSLRHVAGIALILLFIALLPANVHAAKTGLTLRGKPVTPLWIRVPMQVLFIGLTWWSTQ
jgi:uncharacterized membrane protein